MLSKGGKGTRIWLRPQAALAVVPLLAYVENIYRLVLLLILLFVWGLYWIFSTVTMRDRHSFGEGLTHRRKLSPLIHIQLMWQYLNQYDCSPSLCDDVNNALEDIVGNNVNSMEAAGSAIESGFQFEIERRNGGLGQSKKGFLLAGWAETPACTLLRANHPAADKDRSRLHLLLHIAALKLFPPSPPPPSPGPPPRLQSPHPQKMLHSQFRIEHISGYPLSPHTYMQKLRPLISSMHAGRASAIVLCDTAPIRIPLHHLTSVCAPPRSKATSTSVGGCSLSYSSSLSSGLLGPCHGVDSLGLLPLLLWYAVRGNHVIARMIKFISLTHTLSLSASLCLSLSLSVFLSLSDDFSFKIKLGALDSYFRGAHLMSAR